MNNRTVSTLNRRTFLAASAASTATLFLPLSLARAAPRPRRLGPHDKLNVGIIGAGGKGLENINGVSSENIVAICDVDDKRAAEAYTRLPTAVRYRDYRRMLEKEKGLDAVVITTPDHHHAPAALLAMKLGKHVYCEKPLTHSIERPPGSEAPPSHVDWDLWLGPAPARPYHPAYLPFNWRGWWDFGTGALGDMGCHNIDAAFWALKLEYPKSIEAESSGLNPETAPKWSIIRYQFPARGKLPPVELTWYDGGKLPPGRDPAALPKNGCLIVGKKGTIAFKDWNPKGFILQPVEEFKDFVGPPATIPRSPGHYKEWIAACKGGPAALSNFDYAALLTETCLLGNLALRVGRRIEWDAKKMRARNCPEADLFIRRAYRDWGSPG